jgi:hypothetical protein
VHILYLDTEARKVFTPESFTAFRTSRNLRSYLVRAKVPPLVREKGCKKCNKLIVSRMKSHVNGYAILNHYYYYYYYYNYYYYYPGA